MPRKKKHKSATTSKKQKRKAKPTSARKTSPKKQKAEIEVLPVLNAEKLKELYAMMMKCRMLAERVQEDHQDDETAILFLALRPLWSAPELIF